MVPEENSNIDENGNTTRTMIQNNKVSKTNLQDVRKRPGFRVWTFGSVINAAYMILIPSIFIIFTSPTDSILPWNITPEFKGVVAFLLYVFPVYVVLVSCIAMHFYGNVLFNSLFFRNSFLEKYIKDAHSFDPERDLGTKL